MVWVQSGFMVSLQRILGGLRTKGWFKVDLKLVCSGEGTWLGLG